MSKILINYADRGYYHAQKKNSLTATTVGGFDKVIEYGFKDLDKDFINKNQEHFKHQRGAGYWVWKPYIIKKTLEKLNENDVLFYCDSGSHFIDSASPLIDLCVNRSKGLVTFHMEPTPSNKEVLQTKKDTYVIMNLYGEKYTENWAILSGFSVWRKNELTLRIVNEWLYYIQDFRVVSDLPNTCGIPEDPRHIAHRHDQSIFSLLAKKYDIKSYTDPSQYGNDFRLPSDGYSQIIDSTRFRH